MRASAAARVAPEHDGEPDDGAAAGLAAHAAAIAAAHAHLTRQRRGMAERMAAIERRIIRRACALPPRLSVTAWADAYRVLSPESSAEPGAYHSERAPYQRGPMDALSDPAVRCVVLMWPSQVGKTEVMNNFIGQRIHLAPGPMLVLQPTLEMAETWSKDRLAPMLRDTPVLQGRVRDARARDANNTLLHKRFPGGHLTVAGANSPAGLASRPIRDVLCDEVDRYPVSAGTEGDPIGLADRRASTFSQGKRLRISSPTIRGQSRIEREYEASTQERWLVPCPICGHAQVLRWGGAGVAHGLKWDSGQPETVRYICEAGGCRIEEAWKDEMNRQGVWQAAAPAGATTPAPTTRGFWLNALVSPWVRWADLVREWLAVHHDPIRLRQFVNTVLCETWEDEGAVIPEQLLSERLERYAAPVPPGVAVLTRAVDVQGDRLETAVWGWGEGEESWLLDTLIIPGDPGTPEPWSELARQLTRGYTTQQGAVVVPWATVIDSGGHHTQSVYQFARARLGSRVFAIKGSSLEGAPLVGRPTRTDATKTVLYPVGVFAGKELVMSRIIQIREPGPGYVHLPHWLDIEPLRQFTAERLITRIVGGRPKRVWVQHGRNEQLDLAVYALAALHLLGVRTLRTLGDRARQLSAMPTSAPRGPSAAVPTGPVPSQLVGRAADELAPSAVPNPAAPGVVPAVPAVPAVPGVPGVGPVGLAPARGRRVLSRGIL